MIKMGERVVSSPTEFAHYGIKGMRWGVRNEKKGTGQPLRRNTKGPKSINKNLTPKAQNRMAWEYKARQAISSDKDKRMNILLDRTLGENKYTQRDKHGAFKVTDHSSSSKASATLYVKDGRYYVQYDDTPEKVKEYDEEQLAEMLARYADHYNNEEEAERDIRHVKEDALKRQKEWENSKLSSTKATSEIVKDYAKKGADIVKKSLDKARKAIAAAGKAAGKKATELADKGKKALEKLLNIKPGPVKVTSLDDVAKAEKAKREKRNRNQVSVVYNYGAKTVTVSPNASLSKVVKKLGGSTKGWKLQTK